MIKLNETPVRTAKNFGINNIKLEEITIPEAISKFENIEIINKNSNIKIDENVSNAKLTYGLKDEVTKQVNEEANQKININVEGKENCETILKFTLNQKNLELVDNIEIVANKDAKATILIKYETEDEIKAYHNNIIRAYAKEGANITIIVTNLLNLNSLNFMSIENYLEKNANINFCIIDFGGKKSITNYYANIAGENAKNNLNAIYLGKADQLFDLNYITDIRGERAISNIEVQGALKDNARKNFKGTIDFKKGCKKAKGNENEACMLLSDKAKSLALPMLLCTEEDVEGNHSTASGKIGEKELFYIMSRGFEFKEAMKLMVKAKFNNILENIKNEELKNQILMEIDTKLD